MPEGEKLLCPPEGKYTLGYIHTPRYFAPRAAIDTVLQDDTIILARDAQASDIPHHGLGPCRVQPFFGGVVGQF